MKIECNNKSGTVISLESDKILFKNNENIYFECTYTDYKVIDKNYKPYEKSIKDLKEQLKLGSYIKNQNSSFYDRRIF